MIHHIGVGPARLAPVPTFCPQTVEIPCYFVLSKSVKIVDFPGFLGPYKYSCDAVNQTFNPRVVGSSPTGPTEQTHLPRSTRVVAKVMTMQLTLRTSGGSRCV